MFVLVVKVEADVATITVKKKKIEMQLQYYITFCHRIHYTSQWRRIAYKNILLLPNMYHQLHSIH